MTKKESCLFFSFPPQADSQTLAGHGALYSIRCFERRVLCLRGARGRLVVPFLVDDLEADNFMVIVEQAFSVVVPDPKLFAMVTVKSSQSQNL